MIWSATTTEQVLTEGRIARPRRYPLEIAPDFVLERREAEIETLNEVLAGGACAAGISKTALVRELDAERVLSATGSELENGLAFGGVQQLLGSTTAGLPQAAYSSSKAAIIGLTRDLASQWTGRKGIRVNALAPGFFPSEMTDTYPPGYIESQMQRVPAGRAGDPEELVSALIFLASDASSYVTGALLPVDGGMLVT
jgi:hypothetical protein